VTGVDGETTAARLARLSPYFVASIPQAMRARLAEFFLAGPDSAPVPLTVQRVFGSARTILIPRSSRYPPPSYEISRDGPVFRLLPGNIGYVDLDRLTVPDATCSLANSKAESLAYVRSSFTDFNCARLGKTNTQSR
jgi:hypothetical protein